jgi:adenylosuccinate synthase
MSNKNLPHNLSENPLETNVLNDWQGKFRKTLLDVSLLEYAISKDRFIKESEKKNLVITCLDQIKNEYRFTYNGEIIGCSSEREFVSTISEILNIYNVYLSRGSESKQIEKFEW